MEITDEEIEAIVRNIINIFLIPKFRELGMPASGEWEDNVEARRNEIWGTQYTKYLVEGRPPNTDQSPEGLRKFVGWAGSTFIKEWVRDKGIPDNPYAVAYKIAREGTKYYPQGTDLLEVLSTQPVFDYINEQLGKIVILRVQQQFQREFA